MGGAAPPSAALRDRQAHRNLGAVPARNDTSNKSANNDDDSTQPRDARLPANRRWQTLKRRRIVLKSTVRRDKTNKYNLNL